MAKRERKAGKGMKKAEMVSCILDLLHQKPEESYSLKYIFDQLHFKSHPMKMLCYDILQELVEDDYIKEIDRNIFRLNHRGSVLEGIIVRKGYKCYFKPEDGNDEIELSDRNAGHTLNGDKVKVAFHAKRPGRAAEAEVVEILERSNATYVGRMDIQRHTAFLISEESTMPVDIYIPKEKTKGAKHGDKAIVKILDWPADAKNPRGQVVDVLGKAGENNTEMHAILAEFGLPYSYPENVEAAANRIPDEISKDEINRREDYRPYVTFTIDPKDAKDFDDALSVRSLSDGLWEVGVHIADVSHYVTENSVIDKEAVARATSVYLVDRTIPMLPERLCNFICSLRPDEDKLAYSVIFKINEKAEVKDYRICHTVIRSNRRYTYEEAQNIIETQKGDYCEEILILDKLAKILREHRFKEGAIDFEKVEVGFEIDEEGKPISIYFKEAKDAHKLVEEFMLLANKTVAEHIGKVKKNVKPKVFPYRIHDLPDPDKLDNLAQFISKFGMKLKTKGSNKDISKGINHLLTDIHGHKAENLVSTAAIRSMAKARYSTHNIGHYGLAFDYYTHFTSPIRRYPDLMVHRLLTRYIDEGKRSANQQKYEDLCDHSSAMEQLAASAERASIKYKQVEFMSERIGQVFDGTISGITEWGVYVEINENKCEGLIPIRELDDDYYEFDEKNYCLRGRRKKHTYSLGDPLKVEIDRANLERRQLDFKLATNK